MPIVLPDGLPAEHLLKAEGVDVISAGSQRPSPARPLRVAIVNLMPTKAVTERQIARLLGSAPAVLSTGGATPWSFASSI